MVPALLRVTPACCITFVVYEHLITYLLHGESKKNGAGIKDQAVDAIVDNEIDVVSEENNIKADSEENSVEKTSKIGKTV